MPQKYSLDLNDIKRNVLITEYAVHKGFVWNKKKSWSYGDVLDRGDQQIIVITGDAGFQVFFTRGVQIYSKSRDVKNNCGTIIDFALYHCGLAFSDLIKEFSPWLGFKNRPKLDPTTFPKKSKKASFDQTKIVKEYAALEIITKESKVLKFLATRSIPENIVFHDRFHQNLRTNDFGNIIFPHFFNKEIVGFESGFDSKSIVGWEAKNHNFTGSPLSSTKSVWFTARFPNDKRILFAETGIDTMSFFTIFPEYLEDTFAFATSGAWCKEMTGPMIRKVIETFPGHQIISGFDNDSAGDAFHNELVNIYKSIRSDDKIVRKKPTHKDWNDDLRSLINKKK